MSAFSKTTQASATGFPFASILTLIFVVAKLTGLIAWSWWIVFCPLWAGLAIVAAIFAVLIFIGIGIIISAALVALWSE